MSKLTQYGDVKALFVMAADAEYGPHLQNRFTPLITGVGPVEGAVVTTAALSEMKVADTLPDVVISLGSAGSAKLRKTDVFQITEVGYRDMDASPLGFEKGVTPFLDMPATLSLPLRVSNVPEATLSTGANIVHGAAYDAIDADMVDMETFAILRVCHRFDLPLIALRGVSDGDAELSEVSDWTEYLHIIDEKLAGIVDGIGDALSKGVEWPGYGALTAPIRL
ncbi:5'-methylthioadenosine/S-adenosylhomocysteine nucleosidase [Aliiroseovarius sp. KMU-50]|uniref:5'-methylthioadenosine/S-adenosylhomocysteine nucleosidase n=1 Tax=Aliiroseovarius salicola TaxID=3009082 RepID=A0ABT4VXM1_9RHOB|nr:5'-methylthioadenosine/S-adenosylhomocysteine nucleosidase [Aliiroseovarius sp. KMU-50]MDA5092999.1 5'-methylthioadenosine/S-adenosylhomocysteine nucleosidase [Aliiroseovarius sp. KMU-50]